MSAGKGDIKRRVDQAKYGENYERVFGPPKKYLVTGVDADGREVAHEINVPEKTKDKPKK